VYQRTKEGKIEAGKVGRLSRFDGKPTKVSVKKREDEKRQARAGGALAGRYATEDAQGAPAKAERVNIAHEKREQSPEGAITVTLVTAEDVYTLFRPTPCRLRVHLALWRSIFAYEAPQTH